MNKELKIIESYYPPVNRGVIWYDKKINKLKKVVNHRWLGINDSITPLPTMPGDDELVVVMFPYDYIEDVNGLTDYIKDGLSSPDIVESCQVTYNDNWGYGAGTIVYKVTVKLKKGAGENLTINLSEAGFGDTIHVFLPSNKTVIKGDDLQFNMLNAVVFLSKNTEQINNGSIWFQESNGDIVLVQENPPMIAANAIIASYYQSSFDVVSVYVPEEYKNIYKSATNWSSYKHIIPLTELTYYDNN